MQEGFPQIVNISDDIIRLHSMGVLEPLLADRTTGGNILWATDAYAERGPEYEPTAEITAGLITGPDNAGIIQTRARKAFEQQSARTRQRAEVYTPLWVVKKMCDHIDEVWFKRKEGFYKTVPGTDKVFFNKNRTWTAYIKNRRMEITCGEGPFLFSRYEAPTGEELKDVRNRTGLLDRKLRVISENTETEADWMKWALRAFQAVYGYELQGDSLLIARVNALMSFIEHYSAKWGHIPKVYDCLKIADIISWNLWEMDGLTGAIPYRALEIERQEVIQEFFAGHNAMADTPKPCLIMDWRKRKEVEYMGIRKDENGNIKLDFITGNPPYQEETKDTSDKPIYDKFMDGVYEVADRVELIHPARFLFNAGKTPRAWNNKMLSDPHIKVVYYEQNSSKVFSNTDIKGGIAVTYRDATANYGPIGAFSAYRELNDILRKVSASLINGSLDDIIYQQNKWNLDALYSDYPEYREKIGSKGTERRLTTPIFSSLEVFSEATIPNSIKILGLINNKRYFRYIDKKYSKRRLKLLDYTD